MEWCIAQGDGSSIDPNKIEKISTELAYLDTWSDKIVNVLYVAYLQRLKYVLLMVLWLNRPGT